MRPVIRFEYRGPSVPKPVLPRVRVCNSDIMGGLILRVVICMVF